MKTAAIRFTVPPQKSVGSYAPPAPYYVQRRGGGMLETVDQFDTRAEARAMLAEYRVSDPAGRYYLSRRPCKAWVDA